MLRSGIGSVGLVLLLLGCGGNATPLGPRELPNGIPDEGSLLRLPSEGGSALLYRADSLTPLDWQMRGDLPPIARALGTDLDDRMVYVVDDDGEVIGIDLVARRERPYLNAVRRVTGTADGAVLALDSLGRPLIFRGRTATRLPGAPLAGNDVRLMRAPGLSPGVASYSAHAGRLEVRKETGVARSYPVPAGQLASSWFGDVQVITTDSGLVVVDPSSDTSPEFVPLKGMPITSAFSPSAHRLYVARSRGDIVFLNRFDWDEIATLALPGPAAELRPDRSGRWLLARPATGDSIWLIDLVRRERVTTLRGPWADDLPLVSGGRTLVLRSGGDVVAWDIMATPPAARSRLVGAASDRFLQLPWSPVREAPNPVAAPGELARTDDQPSAEDSSTVADSTGTAERIYIQLSQSQNAGWARAQAKQLSEIGYPARVLDPRATGDGYRVVAGPYPSREAADADGRRLGRPYFVMTPESVDP